MTPNQTPEAPGQPTPNQEGPAGPEVPKPKPEAGISSVTGILIALLAAVVVGAGVWAYYQYKVLPDVEKSSETQTIPTKKDETANWKTYTNKTYGYSIKYPNKWYIYLKYADKDYTPRGPEEELAGGEVSWSNYNDFECGSPDTCPNRLDSQTINLAINKYIKSKTIADFVKRNPNSVLERIEKIQDFTTNSGIEGKKYLLSNSDSSSHKITVEYIFIKKEEKVFVFNTGDSGGLNQSTQEIFEKILSTFRFTK